ncbi:MAG: P-loop NTPase fold protein, partial [Opitutales bacterium]
NVAAALDPETQLDAELKALEDFEFGKEELKAAIRHDLENNKASAIIIVDELDRCHPRFAIEFLERVKHFFAIPRLKFVFGIDHEQLCKIARGAFGAEFDAHNYLKRFFDLQFTLPIHTQARLSLDIITHRFNAICHSGARDIMDVDSLTSVAEVLDSTNASIRDKLLIVNKLAVACRINPLLIPRGYLPIFTLGLFLHSQKPRILFEISKTTYRLDFLHELVVFLLQNTRNDQGEFHKIDSHYIPLFLAVILDKHLLVPGLDKVKSATHRRVIIWKKALETLTPSSQHIFQLLQVAALTLK